MEAVRRAERAGGWLNYKVNIRASDFFNKNVLQPP